MIDKKIIREDIAVLETALKNRNSKIDLEKIKNLDERHKILLIEVENLNRQRNVLSAKISTLFAEKKLEQAEELKKEVTAIKKDIEVKETEMKSLFEQLDNELLNIPNIPDSSVPVGKDENDNQEVKKFKEPTKFSFTPKAHWDLVVERDLVDFERATKITGTRFVIYKGDGAKLIRALQAFTLDLHQKAGYTEFLMPVIVNDKALYGTGQLPKFEEDLFKLKDTKYYLSPTVEVQLTNYHRDEILDEKDLPLKYTSSTINFRSEAGSAGKDTRGVIRQHQFYKTELVNIVKPGTSYKALEAMAKQAESILEALELPYRRIVLCTGDMGFSSAKTYDIEVWLPSYNAYKEISSCSNCLDFQSRRNMIRYKNKDAKKNEYVHTLNGSGLAIDRLFAAVVENYQNKDGSITVPKALQPYLNKKTI